MTRAWPPRNFALRASPPRRRARTSQRRSMASSDRAARGRCRRRRSRCPHSPARRRWNRRLATHRDETVRDVRDVATAAANVAQSLPRLSHSPAPRRVARLAVELNRRGRAGSSRVRPTRLERAVDPPPPQLVPVTLRIAVVHSFALLTRRATRALATHGEGGSAVAEGERGVVHRRILPDRRRLVQQDWRSSRALVAVAAVVRTAQRPATASYSQVPHHLEIARARRAFCPIAPPRLAITLEGRDRWANSFTAMRNAYVRGTRRRSSRGPSHQIVGTDRLVVDEDRAVARLQAHHQTQDLDLESPRSGGRCKRLGRQDARVAQRWRTRRTSASLASGQRSLRPCDVCARP